MSRIGKPRFCQESISHNGGESLKTNYNGHNSIKKPAARKPRRWSRKIESQGDSMPVIGTLTQTQIDYLGANWSCFFFATNYDCFMTITPKP